MLKTKVSNLSKRLSNKKGFSIVELIVTVAIMGILVLLGSGKFMNRTKEANMGKHIANVKMLEDSMDRFMLDHDRFPRLSEEAYTSEEIEAYSERIYNITGKEVELDPEGNYYDIDYVALMDYIRVPDNNDKPDYILQNPVGKVFYLEGLSELAKERVDFTTTNPIKSNKDNDIINKGYTNEQIEELISEGYIPVSTLEDLQSVAGGRKYIQTKNIDLSSVSNFRPIGQFSGIYNGGNFTIEKLKINKNGYIGLFESTNEATIENVKLINIDLIGGNNGVGGLVGVSNNSIVNNVYASGKVSSGSYRVGGLIGVSNNNSISNSSVAVDVSGYSFVGGIVGFATGKNTINSSSFTGKVVGDSEVGGLIGRNDNHGIINNSYVTGKTEGTGRYVGGLIGYNPSSSISSINNCYAQGEVIGEKGTTGTIHYVGAIFGIVGRTYTINNSYYDIDTTGENIARKYGTGLTTSKMKQQSSYQEWNFDTVWQINPGKYPTLRQ